MIDLSIVHPVYWISVSLILNQAYDRATDELPPGVDPSEYVIILPDWGGRVSRVYGVENTGRAAAMVVADEDSNVAVFYQGERPVEAVLEARWVVRRVRVFRSVLYDSFVSGVEADCCLLPERRSAIREGRHRTPDRQQQIRMREVLKDRFEDIPVHVPRSEIEALGAEIGLEDPAEAARLFDRLKGVSWRGDYVRSDDGWVAVWVREVN